MQKNFIDILLSFIREGVVYAYLCYMVIYNNMPIADFIMYVTTIAGFTGIFNIVASNFAELYGLSMEMNDYRNFMEQPDVMEKAENPIPLPSPPYSFEFKNVSFKYPKSANYVIHNLNLYIPKGQKLAVVGHNGAGKSTFIKLLLRLYDVSGGEILCNGINNYCIKQAGLADKVNSLKYKADTCVQKFIDDEGISFSGGEEQKLMIARALYKNGGVMVLDEPTAALEDFLERDILL